MAAKKKKPAPVFVLFVRCDADLIAKVERIRAANIAARPGVNMTRSDVVRQLLHDAPEPS